MEGAGREGPLGERGAPVHEEPEPQCLQGALRRIPDAWFVADQAVLARGREPPRSPSEQRDVVCSGCSPFAGCTGIRPIAAQDFAHLFGRHAVREAPLTGQTYVSLLVSIDEVAAILTARRPSVRSRRPRRRP